MSVQIIPVDQQGYGAFNGGEIVENKPIGFPQDRASIRPYSNLFYWAHAKAVTDSTIGLHPHQGFEICSFVLKGEIKHYDTKLKEWRRLQAGDVQIIRAGNGISHSEWMGKGAEMFQIWFDPNLQKTLEQAASYDDYNADRFPIHQQGNARITQIVGGTSPFEMDSPKVNVQRIRLSAGTATFTLDPSLIYSYYVLEGNLRFNDDATQSSDFILVKAENQLNIHTEGDAELFLISSPAELGYRTYSQLRAAH
jgi:redox-sensitive bicupin YhaK (pirin superfamily)